MVDVAHHDGVAACVGKVGARRARLDDFDLRQVGPADRLAQRFADAIVAKFGREHAPAGADAACQRHRQRAVAGADFGDDGAGRESEGLDEAIDVSGLTLRMNQARPCADRAPSSAMEQTTRRKPGGMRSILVRLSGPLRAFARLFAWTNGGTSGIQAVYDSSKERAVMPVTPVGGLHHVTAIAGPAQENLDFYAGVLGMRLVKKSVNQDDPGTYHLFYADGEGHPGTDLTFFPWSHMAPPRDGPRPERRGVVDGAAGQPRVLE